MATTVRHPLVRFVRKLFLVLVGFGGVLAARELHLTYTVLTDGLSITQVLNTQLRPVPTYIFEALFGDPPPFIDPLPFTQAPVLVLLPLSDYLIGGLAGLAIGRLSIRNIANTVERRSPVGPDEQVVAVVRPSWTNWTGLGVLAMLALAGGVATLPSVDGHLPIDVPVIQFDIPVLPQAADQRAGGVLGGTIALGIIAVIAVLRRRSQYLITTRRVINRRGLLRTSITDLPLDRVRSIDTTISLRDRVFRRGTLQIQPHSGDPLELARIPRPHKIADAIHEYRTVVQYQEPGNGSDRDA